MNKSKYVVTLNEHELLRAATVGIRRRISCIVKGLENKFGADDSRVWVSDIEGACGALAYAKWAGVPWPGSVDRFKNRETIDGIITRTMRSDWFDLLVRPTDGDDDVFVLMVGRSPTFRVAGWIFGEDAKRKRWSKTLSNNRPAAFFVPQRELNDPGLLLTYHRRTEGT